MAGVWWWVSGQPRESAAAFVEAFVLGLVFWLCMTNQIHKWAHTKRPPVAVRWLQRSRVILEPGHHAAHHKVPFERCFCITSGWMNPVIDRLGLFGVMERCCPGADTFTSTGPEGSGR
jgi:ubiquitin-conjugating enzyme E2 variant